MPRTRDIVLIDGADHRFLNCDQPELGEDNQPTGVIGVFHGTLEEMRRSAAGLRNPVEVQVDNVEYAKCLCAIGENLTEQEAIDKCNELGDFMRTDSTGRPIPESTRR